MNTNLIVDQVCDMYRAYPQLINTLFYLRDKNPAFPITKLYSDFIINTEFLSTIMWIKPAIQYTMYVNPTEYISIIPNYIQLASIFNTIDFNFALAANYSSVYASAILLTSVFFTVKSLISIATFQYLGRNNTLERLQEVLMEKNLIVKSITSFTSHLCIIFNRLSGCNIPPSAMISPYGIKVILGFIVNIIVITKIHDDNFIIMLNNHIVMISDTLHQVHN